MEPRLTHQVLTLAFKLLHKLRLNITVEFKGAVKWDESVVTVGGLQPPPPFLINIRSHKTLGKSAVIYIYI